MEVGGYDQERAAWKVRVGDAGGSLSGWVPEGLLGDRRKRPAHEDVYRWLDRHAREIERALRDRAAGRPVAAPFDRLSLGED